MKLEIQRMPAGMFCTGKSKPDSMYTSRNPVSATACIAATWLGIMAPIMFPNVVTVNMYRTVATRNGVGSPAKRSPKPMNKIPIMMMGFPGCHDRERADLAQQKFMRGNIGRRKLEGWFSARLPWTWPAWPAAEETATWP